MSETGKAGREQRGEPIPVGVDDGYAMTKVALPDGSEIKIRSQVRAGVHGVSAFGKTAAPEVDGGYESEGQRFTVTNDIEGEGTRFDDYPFSALNRVVVHHALRVAGLGGKQVKIATGLPVSHYYSGGMPNMEITERKTANLKVPVAALSGQPVAQIQGSFVFAEGVAAWVDHCVSSKGEIVQNIGRPAAVVDIGGRTTDCVTVLPGWKVDHARSGTTNKGVLDLYEAVADGVKRQFNVPDIPLWVIEESLTTGQVVMYGKPHDVKPIIDAARQLIGDQILREIQRRIGRAHDLETVLFVGGGAVVFSDLRKRFPNEAVAKNPEFANARGLLKLMQYVV